MFFSGLSFHDNMLIPSIIENIPDISGLNISSSTAI